MAHTYLAEFYDNEGNVQQAIYHMQTAVQLSRQMGLANRELFDLDWMWYYNFLQGNIHECEQLTERGHYLAELIGYSGSAGLGFRMIEANSFYVKREVARAIELIHGSYEQARQAHNINALVVIVQFLVEFLVGEGQWKEAEQISSEALQIMEQEGSSEINCLLAITFAQQGKLVEAHGILQKARDATGPVINFYDQFYLTFAEASLSRCEQRWDEAWQHFDTAYEMVVQGGMRWLEAFVLRFRAEALLARGEPGDPEHARELLEKAQSLYSKMNLPAWAKWIENRLQEVTEI